MRVVAQIKEVVLSSTGNYKYEMILLTTLKYIGVNTTYNHRIILKDLAE